MIVDKALKVTISEDQNISRLLKQIRSILSGYEQKGMD